MTVVLLIHVTHITVTHNECWAASHALINIILRSSTMEDCHVRETDLYG